MKGNAESPDIGELNILLIEDNVLLREGIEDMLIRHGGFTVVSRSEDGDSVRQLKSLDTPPDIVLLDLGLEKENCMSSDLIGHIGLIARVQL